MVSNLDRSYEQKGKVSIPFAFATMMLMIQFIPMSSGNIKYYNCMIAVLFASMFFCKIRKKNFRVPGFMVVYVFTYVMSYIIHYYIDSGRQIIMFLIGFLGVRYIILSGIKSENEFLKFIDYIIIFFALYSIFGIYESFTSINFFDILFKREVVLDYANAIRFGIRRNHGMCSVSINNGMLLNIVLTIAGYRLFNLRKTDKKFLICYILIWTDLVLTLSRQVILMSIIIQLALAAKCGFTWIVKRIACILLILFVLWLSIGDILSSALSNITSMFLPLLEIINPAYSSYYNWNEGIGGIGERTELWGWIYAAVHNQLVFGMGYETPFSIALSNNTIKTSIEVHWLYVLYMRGLFGLTGFIIYQVGCIKKIFSCKCDIGEIRVKFPFVMLILTLGYFVSLFSCSGWEDLKFYYMIFALFECYTRLGGAILFVTSTAALLIFAVGWYTRNRCTSCFAFRRELI